MRLFEALLLASLLPILIGYLRPAATRPLWLRRLPWLSLALLAAHVLLEGWRWQMVPAYLLVVLALLFSLRKPRTTPRRWPRRIARGFALFGGILALGLSALLAIGIPVFTYPAPSGPHGVGTQRLFFTDKSREDPFAPTRGQPRELLANVWYPADVAPGAKPDPFWPKDTDAAAAIGLPGWIFSHLHLIKSHSFAGQPIAKAAPRYPVILFSHGFDSTLWQNNIQMEEWASHGFIVVSIAHTYDSSSVTFPDGRTIKDNVHARTRKAPEADAKALAAAIEKLRVTTEPNEVRRQWRALQPLFARGNFIVEDSIAVWADDSRFVIDQLERLNAGDATAPVQGTTKGFAGRMDLDRLGLAGMSFGGSTTGSVCSIDPRCKAGINMDGWQFGDVIDRPLKVPFLFFSAPSNTTFPVYFGSSANLYEVRVSTAEHSSFTDFTPAYPIFAWLSRLGIPLLGTIDADRMEAILNGFSLAFFQEYLQGKAGAIEAARAAHDDPDVRFTKVPAPPPAVP